MTLRYALLGLLAARAMSGYELSKILDGPLQSVWPAKHSQIYPELARLLDEKLIREAASGPRRRRTYALTAAGRSALRAWLFGTEPDRSSRDEPLLRAHFLWLLEPAEAEELLRRDEELHRRQLAVLREAQRIRPGGPAQRAEHLARECTLRLEKTRADWSAWARKQISDGYLRVED